MMEPRRLKLDKDRAIVVQVAAKIAADMTAKNVGLDERIAEFATLFQTVEEILTDTIFGSASAVQSGPSQAEAVEMIKSSFNATEVEPNTGFSVAIAGKQHGPLPDWLVKACRKDGVTKVYDNRDGLETNPKRPWFKSVDGDKAYWPPRTR
jgi:hypothetical protein